MASLRLIRCGEDRIPECAGIFEGSAIMERYFADGRLPVLLGRAAARGELWGACADGGELLGVMRVVPGGFCGLYHYLALIGTAPAARGKGAGRFLMSEFERMARDAGCRRTCLMVSDFNDGAREFYLRLGYRELGVIPDASRPGIAEHVMLKELEQGEPCNDI